MSETPIQERVRLAKRLGLHPQVPGDDAFRALDEGEHYRVLAHTTWGDQFVPTVVYWPHADAVDRLVDPATSRGLARGALEVAHA